VLRLLIATTNPDKVLEIRTALGALPVEVVTLRDLPSAPEPEETGTTFEDNARLKAMYYDSHFGSARTDHLYTVAEDSGLVVDALDGEPGVLSSRFGGAGSSYAEKFSEIYRRLDEVQGRSRAARFVCAIAVVHRGTVVYETTGTVEGEIAPAPRGSGGFGYDPIFYYPPYGKTLGEVTSEEKLRVAHRGVAMRKLSIWLRERIAAGPRA